MKITEENLEIIKKLGFTCDMDRTGNPMDEYWYSLPSGWGFRVDAIKSFKHLIGRIFKSAKEEAQDYTFCSKCKRVR